MTKANKEQTTRNILKLISGYTKTCTKLKLDNIIFPSWDKLGLLGMIYSQKVKTITLIEPSEICMKRAALHASVFFPEAEIKTINKKFDDLTQNDIICSEETPTLHILSNVLDMTSFDLGKFSGLIKSCLKGSNQFVCVGPYFKYSDRDDKIKVFCNLLDGNAIYAKVFDKFQFDSEKTWTAQVYCFSKNSDECFKKRLDERLHESFVELSRIPSIEAGLSCLSKKQGAPSCAERTPSMTRTECPRSSPR